MPKPVWFRSLYWRIAIGFVAMLATILVLQASLFLWLTGRFADSLSSRTPQQLADQIGRDLSDALSENPALNLEELVRERLSYVMSEGESDARGTQTDEGASAGVRVFAPSHWRRRSSD